MEDPRIHAVQERLRAGELRAGWQDFLEAYAGAIFQAIHHFERDADRASDCFLYACEQLSRDGCRRLLKFRANGPAKFTTTTPVSLVQRDLSEMVRAC